MDEVLNHHFVISSQLVRQYKTCSGCCREVSYNFNADQLKGCHLGEILDPMSVFRFYSRSLFNLIGDSRNYAFSEFGFQCNTFTSKQERLSPCSMYQMFSMFSLGMPWFGSDPNRITFCGPEPKPVRKMTLSVTLGSQPLPAHKVILQTGLGSGSQKFVRTGFEPNHGIPSSHSEILHHSLPGFSHCR